MQGIPKQAAMLWFYLPTRGVTLQRTGGFGKHYSGKT